MILTAVRRATQIARQSQLPACRPARISVSSVCLLQLPSPGRSRVRWQFTEASSVPKSEKVVPSSNVVRKTGPNVSRKRSTSKTRRREARMRHLLKQIKEQTDRIHTQQPVNPGRSARKRRKDMLWRSKSGSKEQPGGGKESDALMQIVKKAREREKTERRTESKQEGRAEGRKEGFKGYVRHLEEQRNDRSWYQPKSDMNVSSAQGDEEATSTEGKQKYLWPDLNVAQEGRDKSDKDGKASKSATRLWLGDEVAERRRVCSKSESSNEKDDRLFYTPWDEIPTPGSNAYADWTTKGRWSTVLGGKMTADDVLVQNVEPLRPMDVPQLAHGLDRVLFNPGVHWLRDVRSGIYNFDPSIRSLYDVDLFDYSALPPYLTSSIDDELAALTRKHGKRYSGSTSSLTALLSQIYFFLSAWKLPPLTGFTEGFRSKPKGFSFGAKLPANVLLRRFEDVEGTQRSIRYAVDSDKSASGEVSNANYVLTQLGKSVEKLLTSSKEEYEMYLRVNSHKLSEETKNKKEAYHYSMTDKFMLRSQLDCTDERLPRRTFDLKTRAVVAVRMDRANWVESSGYMIRRNTGVHESFEREMWDMSRGTLLKYFFQARIGNMDGIMVAYHSTSTMFGFQYLSREELAERLFGSEEMGEQAFKLSIGLLEKIFDAATSYFPDNTLRITLDAQAHEIRRDPTLSVFARIVEEELSEGEEVKEEEEEDRRKSILLNVDVDRYLSDMLVHGPVDFHSPKDYSIDASADDEIARVKRRELPPLSWHIEYAITPCSELDDTQTAARLYKVHERQKAVSPLQLPNVAALNEREIERQAALQENPEAWKKFLDDRRTGRAPGMPVAPGQVVPEAEEEEDAMTEAEDEEGKTSVKLMQRSDVETSSDVDEELSEKEEDEDAVHEEVERDEPPHTQTVRWVKSNASVNRLRLLSQLGQKDKDELAKSDRLEVYERRGD